MNPNVKPLISISEAKPPNFMTLLPSPTQLDSPAGLCLDVKPGSYFARAQYSTFAQLTVAHKRSVIEAKEAIAYPVELFICFILVTL